MSFFFDLQGYVSKNSKKKCDIPRLRSFEIDRGGGVLLSKILYRDFHLYWILRLREQSFYRFPSVLETLSLSETTL
eukprot:UN23601